jgi:hypothetical protein
MKTNAATPTWAIELTTQVCKDYKRALPGELLFRSRPRVYHAGGSMVLPHGVGGYYRMKSWRRPHSLITINVGITRNDDEIKCVLLHELAHHLVSRRGWQGHTIKFWVLCFELFDRYDVDMDYAKARSFAYKDRAKNAFEKFVSSSSDTARAEELPQHQTKHQK